MAEGSLRLRLRYRPYGLGFAKLVGRALLWAGVPESRAVAIAERFVFVRWQVGSHVFWTRVGG